MKKITLTSPTGAKIEQFVDLNTQNFAWNFKPDGNIMISELKIEEVIEEK